MSDEAQRNNKEDRWWRDFWVYGGATHGPLLPLVLTAVFSAVAMPLLSVISGCQKSNPTVILYCAQDQVFAEPILGVMMVEWWWCHRRTA